MPKKTPPPKIDAAEILNRARRARVDEINAKMAAGERVSKSDIKEVENYAKYNSPPDKAKWAKTKMELAAMIGCSRRTLDKYWDADPIRKPKTRPSGEFPVEEWAQYINHCADRPERILMNIPDSGKIEAKTEGEASTGHDYKLRQQRADAIKSERQLAILEKEYIPTEKARQDVLACNERVRAELMRLFLQTAPAEYALCDGDSTKCKAINQRLLNEALENLHNGSWT